MKTIIAITLISLMCIMTGMAYAQPDSIYSSEIREADGTSGQNTNTGSGIKTGYIQNGAVTAVKIRNAAVKTGKIADGAVTNEKIANGAVTDEKITGPINGSKISSTGLDADTLDGFDATGFASTTHNHNGVYSPVGHNHDGTYALIGHSHSYANVAVVALSGGDYTDPVTAMNDVSSWCGAPSAINPCLLKIMPGVYGIGINSLQMQSYVDIEGSGENTTRIKGNIDSYTSGVVNGANNSEIRFLTVENTGGSYYATAIYNNNSSPKMTNVTATASGGDWNCGVSSFYSGTVRIDQSVIRGTNTIYNTAGVTTYVGSSRLDGGAVLNDGTLTCAGVYDENYVFYANTCP